MFRCSGFKLSAWGEEGGGLALLNLQCLRNAYFLKSSHFWLGLMMSSGPNKAFVCFLPDCFGLADACLARLLGSSRD